MSLEDALNANTKAVLAHTAVLERMLAGAKPAAAAADKAPATDKPAAANKPAPKPAAAAKKTRTIEDVAKIVTDYLKGAADKETRDSRKAEVGSINEHYGVVKFTDIPMEQMDEALGYLDDYKAGRVPSFVDDNGGVEDDGDTESMV